MTLTSMKVGVLPYSDGSGYRFEISINDTGKIEVRQGGESIIMDRSECRAVMDALDTLWHTADQISRVDQ